MFTRVINTRQVSWPPRRSISHAWHPATAPGNRARQVHPRVPTKQHPGNLQARSSPGNFSQGCIQTDPICVDGSIGVGATPPRPQPTAGNSSYITPRAHAYARHGRTLVLPACNSDGWMDGTRRSADNNMGMGAHGIDGSIDAGIDVTDLY